MRYLSSLLAVASVVLTLPFTFVQATRGCSSPSYRFQTAKENEANRISADHAKVLFCDVVDFWKKN